MNMLKDFGSDLDFSFLEHELIQDSDVQVLKEMTQNVHCDVDVFPLPNFLTKIQDTFENGAVVYSARDIEEMEFIGVNINDEEVGCIGVSFGKIGETAPMVTLRFQKNLKQGQDVFTLKFIDSPETEYALNA